MEAFIKILKRQAHKHQDSPHIVQAIETQQNIFSKLIDHAKNIKVNSFHHQAVRNFNSQVFEVAAFEADGTIEALEFKNGRGILFQFHPEFDDNEPWHRLFAENIR